MPGRWSRRACSCLAAIHFVPFLFAQWCCPSNPRMDWQPVLIPHLHAQPSCDGRDELALPDLISTCEILPRMVRNTG